MNKASGIGQNWLRAAVDTIVQRTLKEGKKLPIKELNAFLANTKRIPASRRLAFELIQKASPKRAAKLVPGFIDDPAPELRRDAVALIIEDALAESNEKSACALYEKALYAARDVDQIEATAKALLFEDETHSPLQLFRQISANLNQLLSSLAKELASNLALWDTHSKS